MKKYFLLLPLITSCSQTGNSNNMMPGQAESSEGGGVGKSSNIRLRSLTEEINSTIKNKGLQDGLLIVIGLMDKENSLDLIKILIRSVPSDELDLEISFNKRQYSAKTIINALASKIVYKKGGLLI